MTTDFVQQELAKIAAQKAAKAAERAAAAPATPTASSDDGAPLPAPSGAVVTATTTEPGKAPVTQVLPPEPPGRPADCSPEDWAAMPEEVRALVAAGAGGQAVPVNPPEASAGLVASATETVDAITPATPAEPKAKRGRKPAAPPPPPVDLTPVVEAINANTSAIRELTSAVLGAAQILAG
jgi:hypothetical protein